MKAPVKERHFGPVWFIPGDNHGRYPNCHSIYIEGDGVLIDPASDRDRLIQLREGPGVRQIWLTHWHEDHFMHLDLFDDLPLLTSRPDAPPLADLDAFLDAYGMEGTEEREYWRAILRDQFHYRSRKPTRFLGDGDIIPLKTGNVAVMATPGHTPGHLSFFFQPDGVLLLGDYDLTRFGPWYGDRDSSIQETIASIERLRQVPAKIWLASHEKGVFEEAPGDLWDDYLGVINERENELVGHLQTPQTLEGIVAAWIIYGRPREPKAFFEFGERVHMKKHLEKLMREGRVIQEGEMYVRR
ncbi:MAG: MBL fold metallo-hydrolase [Deltaproteobacteria bacterium]|nr:MBL fold metallo-hydrolase [Deltaproteobacteria bacterium]